VRPHGAQSDRQREAGLRDAAIQQHERQPSQDPIGVGHAIDEASQVGGVAQCRRIEQCPERIVQLQLVQRSAQRDAGRQGLRIRCRAVEIQIARADDVRARKTLRQEAVVVQQPLRDTLDRNIQAEVALHARLHIRHRRAIGLWKDDVQPNRGRPGGKDTVDEVGNAIARPWPLAHGGEAGIVDVDHDCAGTRCRRRRVLEQRIVPGGVERPERPGSGIVEGGRHQREQQEREQRRAARGRALAPHRITTSARRLRGSAPWAAVPGSGSLSP
jgi:hypothetical protein